MMRRVKTIAGEWKEVQQPKTGWVFTPDDPKEKKCFIPIRLTTSLVHFVTGNSMTKEDIDSAEVNDWEE